MTASVSFAVETSTLGDKDVFEPVTIHSLRHPFPTLRSGADPSKKHPAVRDFIGFLLTPSLVLVCGSPSFIGL